MWEPGETNPEQLLGAAGSIGQLIVERQELSVKWEELYNEGVINAFKDNEKFPEAVLKVYGRQYAQQKDPEVFLRLLEIEGTIEAMVSTASLVTAATRTNHYLTESPLAGVGGHSTRT